MSIAGHVVEIEPGWSITRPAGVTSTMQFTLMGRVPEHFTYIPQDDDPIEARAGGASGVLLFGGYVDAPKVRQSRANLIYTVQAVGWRHRLNDRRLTQLEGINIAKMTSAAAQLTALIGLLSGEGFQAVADLPIPDVPYRGDMRFGYVGPLADEIAKLNDAIVSVLPDKRVPVQSRQNLTALRMLDWEQVAEIGFEGSRQDYRTRHIVRGGDLLQQQSVSGRADGRYRLGGVQNITPAQSLFDAPIGSGVLWNDERSRGGRGNSVLVVLLDPADNDQPLPTTVVAGSDRAIDSLLLTDEAGLVYDGPDIDASKLDDYALLIQASDGSEYAFRLAEMAIENGPIQYSEPTISLPNIGSQVSLDLSELSLADSYTAGVYTRLSIAISGSTATIRRTGFGGRWRRHLHDQERDTALLQLRLHSLGRCLYTN